jgi:hypothetical protein
VKQKNPATGNVPWILNLESGGGMFAAKSATGARNGNWGGSRPVITHIQRHLGGVSEIILGRVTIYANFFLEISILQQGIFLNFIQFARFKLCNVNYRGTNLILVRFSLLY